MSVLFEACLDSLELATRAEQGGAGRIELCDRLDVGGTTPSRALIEDVVRSVRIPVFPIIRPRGGDFCYNAAEVDSMRRDAEMALDAGAAGIVIGILHEDRTVDAQRTREVMRVAQTAPVTFHMAFDETPDQSAALDALMEVGITRVLTRGGARRAIDGVERLRELVEQSAGHIHVLAGGSIRADNAEEIVRRSGVREIHSRGLEVADIIAAGRRGDRGVSRVAS